MHPDLDLRLVRYFTVVAEHLNFARAAEELRVAQPSLSRQIQRLENALGVRLLERTTQGSRLTAADIWAEPLVGCTGMGAEWSGFWRLEPRPDGEPAPLGPTLADSYDDKLEAIADGTAIAVVPAGDQRSTLRPDLVTVPIDEIEACQVVVATRAAETDLLVAEFVRSAENLLTRHAPSA